MDDYFTSINCPDSDKSLTYEDFQKARQLIEQIEPVSYPKSIYFIENSAECAWFISQFPQETNENMLLNSLPIFDLSFEEAFYDPNFPKDLLRPGIFMIMSKGDHKQLFFKKEGDETVVFMSDKPIGFPGLSIQCSFRLQP